MLTIVSDVCLAPDHRDRVHPPRDPHRVTRDLPVGGRENHEVLVPPLHESAADEKPVPSDGEGAHTARLTCAWTRLVELSRPEAGPTGRTVGGQQPSPEPDEDATSARDQHANLARALRRRIPDRKCGAGRPVE